ncbi:MAG: hypothetical protein CFK49_06995 [Armatimonadetes bacterium JP3_11]|jgi:hypothetical protein|nr:MAG: hypothetical protein CFK48_05520 [Armatimonadetes bacterium CP1_7O]OYT74717.1 MAG: hypothetical protein CFK49_06995 [Armatimonadetes bacterium JP3_11]RMH10825.1 MAG: hypothetical protein D6697_00155 [Armatimonadota bacterium]
MSDFERILSELEPPETCEVSLTGKSGEAIVFTFAIPKSYGEWERLEKQSRAFIAGCKRLQGEPYEQLRDLSESDLRLVFFLHALCKQPEWTQVQWGAFVRRAGVAAGQLFARVVELVGGTVGQAEQRALELEKKGSA